MINREEAALAYVQQEILSYLEEDSRHCDTLNGILDWWVYRQRIASAPQLVRSAVSGLVREGRLFERRRRGAEPLYAAQPSAFPETSNPNPNSDPDEE